MCRNVSALCASLFVGLLSAAPAQSQVCGHALSAQINNQGLAILAEHARDFIPSHFVIPATRRTVVDLPLITDPEIQTQPLPINLAVRDFQVAFAGNVLRITGTGNVQGNGALSILHPFVGFGQVDCNLAVDLRDASFNVAVTLPSQPGSNAIQVTDLQVAWNEALSSVDLRDCLLGDLTETVLSWLHMDILGLVQEHLQGAARSDITSSVSAQLLSNLTRSGQFKAFNYTARLDSLYKDPDRVHIDVGAEITAADSAGTARCGNPLPMPPPFSCASSPFVQFDPGVSAMVGVALSQDAANQALRAAWRTGTFCIDSRTLQNQGAGGPLSQLLSLGNWLGDSGATVAFRVMPQLAPEVHFSEGVGAELFMPGMQIAFDVSAPLLGNETIIVATDIAVAAQPTINPATNSIGIQLQGARIPRLEIRSANGGFVGNIAGALLSAAQVEQLIRTVVIPQLNSTLNETALSPAVFDLDAFHLVLKQVQIKQGYAAAYLDFFVPGAQTETQPPETDFVQPTSLVFAPGVVPFAVLGSDNVTPPQLMRYLVRLDGGPWSQPRYGQQVEVNLASRRVLPTAAGGIAAPAAASVVEVAAIDLQGNVDPTPARIEVAVDDISPIVQVMQTPPELVPDGAIEVNFSGSDDRTAPSDLTYRVELWQHAADAAAGASLVKTLPALVAQPDDAFVRGLQQARFAELGDGAYTLRVIGRDQAGNLAAADAEFVVSGAAAAGCHVSATPSGRGGVFSFGVWIMLGLLAARLRSRRSHGRAVAVVVKCAVATQSKR